MKQFVRSMFPLLGLVLCLTLTSCPDDPEFEGPEFEMSLNKTTLALEVGKSETLVVSYNPSDTPNQGHTWGSSKPEIATVDETGKVTAKAIGECTITARSLTGNVSTTCKVQVVDKIIRVTSVSLNKTSATLAIGEKLTLEATILPSNATNKGVKWSSSSNEIAKVDSKGEVTAVAEGEATITVTTDDNSKKATCKLNIVPAGVKFSEPTIENITSNSAYITGTVEPIGVKVTEMGICCSTKSTPTVETGKIMLSTTGGNIAVTIEKLNPETTYYLRFYAIVDGIVKYGNQTVFETLPAVTISAPTFTDVMAHSATVKGTISANGSTLTETGIVYSKTSMPTVADTKVVVSSENISYSLMELEASTTYYVRIYAIIGDKTYYGEQAELVTIDELKTHFEPYEFLLKLGGNCDISLSSMAPKGYKTINVCYGTNPEPKITNNAKTLTVESDGKIYLKMNSLDCNRTYYIRSYSKIGSKIEYSKDIVAIKPPIFNKNSDIVFPFWENGKVGFLFNSERINYYYYVDINYNVQDRDTYYWESSTNKDTKFYYHGESDDYANTIYTSYAGIVTVCSDFKDRYCCRVSLTNIETNVKYILEWTY